MSTFTVEELEGLRFGSFGDLELIEEEIIDQSRWSVLYRYTFRAPKRPHSHGDVYQFLQQRAATENQDDDPIEPDDVIPVIATEIIKTTYIPVP